MKKILKLLFLIFGSFIGLLTILFVCLMIFGKGNLLMPVAKKEVFTDDNLSQYPSPLHTEKNKIVNLAGETVLLKGLMVPELQKLNYEGNFKESFFEEVFACGGNVIRIPIHPEEWVADEYYLWRYLDSVVAWAGKNEKYVIIDLHFIGNIENGTGAEMADVGEAPYEFSINFWNTVASYFKDVPNVIFEIYNEPAMISDTRWKSCAQTLVDTIRETGATQLILVSGIDYSYDISIWENHPIQDENVAYTSHIFPNRYGWKNELSSLSNLYPVLVTEWGFISEEGFAKQTYLSGNRTTYGEPLANYMEENGIGWIACWYDDGWEPPMFLDERTELTDWGQFVMELLKE